MIAVLVFSVILLLITLGNYKIMQKEVREGSTCPDEKNEVKNNWKWHKIFLWVSIAGIVIGLIGVLLGYAYID